MTSATSNLSAKLATSQKEPDQPTTAVQRFQITLPLPPREASPNQHIHWRYQRGATGKVTAYRDLCAAMFRNSGIPQLRAPVTIHLEFFYCRGKPETHPFLYKWRRVKREWQFLHAICRDEDNARASVKALQDALIDAGIIVGKTKGDGKRNVRSGFCTLYTTAKEHGGKTCVRVTLEGEAL